MATASTESFRKGHIRGTSGTAREHVVVSNYGWYLFNTLPLVCGNATPGARMPCVFFRNDVTTDIVHDRLTAYAAEQRANVTDLTFFSFDNFLFKLPYVEVPIPYLLCYRERLISGILVDPTPPVTAARPDSGEDDLRKRDLRKLLDQIPDGGVK